MSVHGGQQTRPSDTRSVRRIGQNFSRYCEKRVEGCARSLVSIHANKKQCNKIAAKCIKRLTRWKSDLVHKSWNKCFSSCGNEVDPLHKKCMVWSVWRSEKKQSLKVFSLGICQLLTSSELKRCFKTPYLTVFYYYNCANEGPGPLNVVSFKMLNFLQPTLTYSGFHLSGNLRWREILSLT